MRAVLTRVRSASVVIDGQTVGQIGKGFLILLGVGPNDTEKECRYLAEKALGLRIFEDENGKMNLNLEQVGGSLLVVSQFTLFADTSSRRPGFTGAAKPDKAIFEQMLCEAQLVPEETLFIDDSEANCQSASELGIQVHRYLIGENLKKIFE